MTVRVVRWSSRTPSRVLQLLDHLGHGGARHIQVMRRLREAAPLHHPGEQPHRVEPVHGVQLF